MTREFFNSAQKVLMHKKTLTYPVFSGMAPASTLYFPARQQTILTQSALTNPLNKANTNISSNTVPSGIIDDNLHITQTDIMAKEPCHSLNPQ